MQLNEEQQKRFWAKVVRGESDDCWEWTGALRVGYGAFKLNGKTVGTHRVAYFLETGETPPMVCHYCDNCSCCNSAHLFGGTNSDNMKDAYRKGRVTLPSQVLIPEEVLGIVTDYQTIPNGAEIARRRGLNLATVAAILNGSTWGELTGISRHKLKHPTSRKLTQAQVDQIRYLHTKKQYTTRQLANDFKVTPTTIYHIMTGKTW